MRFSDYKCKSCGIVFEHIKNDLDDFPELLECPECKNASNRVYSNLTFSVAEGLCGNADTGYSKGITYQTNSIVQNPKGKKVKTYK